MNSIEDIIMLVAYRDKISPNEARAIVNDCIEELRDAVLRGNYQETEDIVMMYLGLEPDYLDILLNEMY